MSDRGTCSRALASVMAADDAATDAAMPALSSFLPLEGRAARPEAAAPARGDARPGGPWLIHDSRAGGELALGGDASQARVHTVLRLRNAMRAIILGLVQGESVCLDEARAAVRALVGLTAHDAPALFATIRLLARDNPRYYHSVSVCALMANMARHLHLPDERVQELGLAGLLHDVGKTAVPGAILHKPGRLTAAEMHLIRRHPDDGHARLAGIAGVSATVLEVCRFHHEKYDGTGYPLGLKGEAIGFAARMGAICDAYDALTSDRAYKRAWSPAMTIDRMWSWDGHFDRTLLFAFMKSIGVFPAGLLVRLRSERLGVTMRRVAGAGVRPRALAFYCARTRRPVVPQVVAVGQGKGGDMVLSFEEPDRWGFCDWPVLSETLLAREGAA